MYFCELEKLCIQNEVDVQILWYLFGRVLRLETISLDYYGHYDYILEILKKTFDWIKAKRFDIN